MKKENKKTIVVKKEDLKIKYEYGIFQASGTSCILYKRDERFKDKPLDVYCDKSTFQLAIGPEEDNNEKQEIIVIVDNEQIKKKSLFGTKGFTQGDAYRVYGHWASGAPLDFDLKAKKCMGYCLKTELRTPDVTTETGIKGSIDIGMVSVEGSHKKEKTQLKNK